MMQIAKATGFAPRKIAEAAAEPLALDLRYSPKQSEIPS